jgi:hypothetical protein
MHQQGVTMPTHDFDLSDQGSIAILTPRTPAAIDWTEEHIPEDAPRWGARGIAIERRYLPAILEGIAFAGLV